MDACAVVTNIQGYSIHDGPGIRTTVFLKGCPLRCRWCANPENLSPAPQMGFLKALCLGCDRCAAACGAGAIVPGKDVYRLKAASCTLCGACEAACPGGALVRYGRERTAADVFQEVRRDKLFYDASGGGVTLSGGEPLLHPGFATELFRLLRGEGISTCVESCGAVPWAALEAVLPLTDVFFFDLKHMDAGEHRRWTGQDNAGILDNARRLAQAGADVRFRQPLIPGVNDGEANLAATAAFLHSIGRAALELMPYHRAGKPKYAALDLRYETEDLAPMPPEALHDVQEAYQALGIDCGISR